MELLGGKITEANPSGNVGAASYSYFVHARSICAGITPVVRHSAHEGRPYLRGKRRHHCLSRGKRKHANAT